MRIKVIGLIALGAVVIGIVWAAFVTQALGGMPASGWAVMIFGIVLTVAVGVGLMALVFHSSRSGYDEVSRGLDDPSRDVELDRTDEKNSTSPHPPARSDT